jgi:hypothetical protein
VGPDINGRTLCNQNRPIARRRRVVVCVPRASAFVCIDGSIDPPIDSDSMAQTTTATTTPMAIATGNGHGHSNGNGHSNGDGNDDDDDDDGDDDLHDVDDGSDYSERFSFLCSFGVGARIVSCRHHSVSLFVACVFMA